MTARGWTTTAIAAAFIIVLGFVLRQFVDDGLPRPQAGTASSEPRAIDRDERAAGSAASNVPSTAGRAESRNDREEVVAKPDAAAAVALPPSVASGETSPVREPAYPIANRGASSPSTEQPLPGSPAIGGPAPVDESSTSRTPSAGAGSMGSAAFVGSTIPQSQSQPQPSPPPRPPAQPKAPQTDTEPDAPEPAEPPSPPVDEPPDESRPPAPRDEPQPTPSTATVRMIADAGEVAVGAAVTIRIAIVGGANVGSVPFHVVFNPAVLRFESGQEGPFLAGDGRETAFFAAPMSSGDAVVVGLSRLGGGQGIGGSGDLCWLRFTAVGPGSAGLAFRSAKVRDGDNKIVPASFQPAVVVVR